MKTGKSGGRKALSQPATSPRRRVLVDGRSERPTKQTITLLTDFGASDHFVAAMKGVILSLNPFINIIDITHEVSPQDIDSAAFLVLAVHESFAPGTVHVAVVDPGVGTDRLPVAIEAGGQIFVGPDNGVFGYICERHRPAVHAITNERLFRHPVSSTFHGRDVFAPVAAALASGTNLKSVGPRIDDWVRLAPLAPQRVNANRLQGRILHIDRFGNCITNISPRDLLNPKQAILSVKGKRITSFRRFFAGSAADKASVFAYWGSAGFLELAVRNASAAKVLKARVGERINVSMP
jgi:S-adenosylmethionine hydrolase